MVPEAACAISAETGHVPSGRSAGEVWRLAGRSDEAVIEAGRLAAPLSVRNRRPGDAFRPLGLRRAKEAAGLLRRPKMDRVRARDYDPVIVDSAGRIVWVAGHALAEEFRVTDAHKSRGNLEKVTYLGVRGRRG